MYVEVDDIVMTAANTASKNASDSASKMHILGCIAATTF